MYSYKLEVPCRKLLQCWIDCSLDIRVAVESHWHWHHTPLHPWPSPWNSKVDLHPTLCMEQWHHQLRTQTVACDKTNPSLYIIPTVTCQTVNTSLYVTHTVVLKQGTPPYTWYILCHWWNSESIIIFFTHKFNYFSTFFHLSFGSLKVDVLVAHFICFVTVRHSIWEC